MKPCLSWTALALFGGLLSSCGGDAPVELSVDPAPRYATSNVVVLSGRSFVPPGSHCPASNEYVIIGTLGPHDLSYTNASTGATGPVFNELWVCNADEGRSMRWNSNPITLAPGDNVITVTMEAGGRRSSATVTVRPFGS